MKKTSIFFLPLLVCLALIFSAQTETGFAQDRTKEINRYLEMLESVSFKTRIDAAKYISRSGLTDKQLFEVVNKKLLNGYGIKTDDLNHIDEMAWLCKALASSGLTDYAPTLEKIIDTTYSFKLKKNARQSLNMLAEYADRNRLMNDTSNFDPSLSDDANRCINMLRSDKVRLKTDAAKAIYRGKFSEKAVYDAARDELLKGYKTVSPDDRFYLDAMAWMCKALGASRRAEYRDVLTEIVENSSNPKLQKYAKQGLKRLY